MKRKIFEYCIKELDTAFKHKSTGRKKDLVWNFVNHIPDKLFMSVIYELIMTIDHYPTIAHILQHKDVKHYEFSNNITDDNLDGVDVFEPGYYTAMEARKVN